MVEAALILPVVILAVFAVIYLCIEMYEQVTMQCSEHMEFRWEYQGELADYARRVDFVIKAVFSE